MSNARVSETNSDQERSEFILDVERDFPDYPDFVSGVDRVSKSEYFKGEYLDGFDSWLELKEKEGCWFVVVCRVDAEERTEKWIPVVF